MGRKGRRKTKPGPPEPTRPFQPRWALILLGVFVLSLAPRLYGGLTFGTDLEGPGTFTLINFDEGGSCRAVIGGFPYPTFLGRQVVAIGKLLGFEPQDHGTAYARGRRYCHSRPLIWIARSYSAVVGALTVVLVGLLALLMWPTRPQIAWTACAILGLSNFHVAESHWGTADAPQVFFIYLLVTVVSYGVAARKGVVFVASLPLLVAAIWTKWYVFAIFAYLPALMQLDLKGRAFKYVALVVGALLAAFLVIFWGDIWEVLSRRSGVLWGNETSRFGSGYANIGTWRRWIRNSVNLPLVHIVGIGLPACAFVWSGFKHALADRANRLLWLGHAPAMAYATYMLLIGPVTYYRYYLPLFPTVALLAAYGLWQSRWGSRPVFLAFFLLYPGLLTLDMEYNLRNDPRRDLVEWNEGHRSAKAYATFYATPWKPGTTQLFSMDQYLRFGRAYLGRADYLILSEAWYDTSYANELNGPIAWRPEWLIKTRPELVRGYRAILSGEDPNLELSEEFNLRHIAPELLIHRLFYGSFPLLVGDIKIFRVTEEAG